MSTAETFDLDETGKIDLSNIYDRTDPRTYYSTLRRLEYIIPETAKPVFQSIISTFRRTRDRGRLRILDVGCSYGINAAMLKCDLEMEDLYSFYDPGVVAGAKRNELVERDRRLMADLVKDRELEVVGLDVSEPALGYAQDANLLDATVGADLENGTLSTQESETLRGADLVISTGCVGYVTEQTIGKILEANAPRRPWMVHFVLRMFPFTRIQEVLEKKGYVTEKVETQTFLQRRFASQEERRQVLKRLDSLGIDPQGLEATGWYHAEAFISCPEEDCASFDLRPLVSM